MVRKMKISGILFKLLLVGVIILAIFLVVQFLLSNQYLVEEEVRVGEAAIEVNSNDDEERVTDREEEIEQQENEVIIEVD